MLAKNLATKTNMETLIQLLKDEKTRILNGIVKNITSPSKVTGDNKNSPQRN